MIEIETRQLSGHEIIHAFRLVKVNSRCRQ